LCSTAFAVAAQPAWELAPPDAKVLIGVDIRGLRNSSLTDSMTPQMRAQMQAPLAMLHIPGIELLDDVDSVFLASTADLTASTKTAAPGAGSKTGDAAPKTGTTSPKPNAPFLVVITGTFPDEHLRPLLKGLHPSYKGINVYRGTGADTTSVAVLDEHTVLLGDDKSIYRAIDRKTTGLKAQGPLLARARELASSNEIWIVARDSSGALQKASGPAALFISEIEGLDLGLAVRDGFNMDISLATKTEAGAEALAQMFATQMQSAVNAKLDGQKAQDFWRKVKMGSDGKRVQMQISMTKEELQENIRLAQDQRGPRPGFQVAGGPSAMPPPLQAAAPPKPAGPRVVKIYGLDDGVHEVHLDQSR
jgi:hypothetical protein